MNVEQVCMRLQAPRTYTQSSVVEVVIRSYTKGYIMSISGSVFTVLLFSRTFSAVVIACIMHRALHRSLRGKLDTKSNSNNGKIAGPRTTLQT
jgi:hypothetical protein